MRLCLFLPDQAAQLIIALYECLEESVVFLENHVDISSFIGKRAGIVDITRVTDHVL